MRIEVEYGTQIRTAVGRERESVDLVDEETLAQLLAKLAAAHEPLATWLTIDGALRAGVLVFVNDQTPYKHAEHRLKEGDHVSLLTLVSGG